MSGVQLVGSAPDRALAGDGVVSGAEFVVLLGDATNPPADPRQLQRAIALHGELGRSQAGHLRYAEEALAAARGHVVELSESRDGCASMLEGLRAELEELKETPGHRIDRAARRALARVGRR